MRRPVAFAVFGVLFAVVVLIAIAIGASLFLNGAPVVASDKVAVIKVEGVIMDSEDIVRQLKKYADNESVKAVVLRVNSPGGAVAPSQEIYSEVIKHRKKTGQKVVVSMGSVAASGGYYIAVAADRIVANPGSLTGSIGVIMEFATIEDLMAKLGIKGEVVKSGEKKDVGNIMRAMTPEEREYLQVVINDVHDQFVDAVAKGRKMKKEDVLLIADGGIFTGRQAKENGLVDELGDFEDAVDIAAKLGGIEGEPKVITEEKDYSLFDILKGEDMGEIFRKTFGARSPNLMYLYSGSSAL